MLTQGIKPPPTADDTLGQMQSKLDRAKTSRERDSIYAAAASALLAQGDERARDIADKIEDAERRNANTTIHRLRIRAARDQKEGSSRSNSSGPDGEVVEHEAGGGLYRYRPVIARHRAAKIVGSDRRGSAGS